MVEAIQTLSSNLFGTEEGVLAGIIGAFETLVDSIVGFF